MKKYMFIWVISWCILSQSAAALDFLEEYAVDRTHHCYGDPDTEHHERQSTANSSTPVDFRHPKRSYVQPNSPFSLFVEKSLADQDSSAYKRSINKLNDTLTKIHALLPPHTLATLKSIPIYMLHGPDSPHGGNPSGMAYFRIGEREYSKKIDTRWNNAIVIYSAQNFLNLDAIWTKKALVHEYAHAWHLLKFPVKHDPILSAYHIAKYDKRYRDIKNRKGEIKRSVYAMTNHLEYFAELSSMYFVEGDYCPFNRDTLKAFDPTGYAMVENVWSP